MTRFRCPQASILSAAVDESKTILRVNYYGIKYSYRCLIVLFIVYSHLCLPQTQDLPSPENLFALQRSCQSHEQAINITTHQCWLFLNVPFLPQRLGDSLVPLSPSLLCHLRVIFANHDCNDLFTHQNRHAPWIPPRHTQLQPVSLLVVVLSDIGFSPEFTLLNPINSLLKLVSVSIMSISVRRQSNGPSRRYAFFILTKAHPNRDRTIKNSRVVSSKAPPTHEKFSRFVQVFSYFSLLLERSQVRFIDMTPLMIHTAVRGMSSEKIDLKLPFNFTISYVPTRVFLVFVYVLDADLLGSFIV